MNKTRREFITTVVGTIAAVGTVVVGAPSSAQACLYGKWQVRCANGHIDIVDDGTCQHKCEKCGLQVFDGHTVTVVCPVGHANRVDTGTYPQKRGHPVMESYKCSTCGRECRIG
jgi:DNA-directed RNA polymerase subunit RPC12/RpoP